VVSVLVDGREAATLSPFGSDTAPRQIVLAVQPGPAFTFSTARVAPVPPGTELPEGFAPGKPAYSALIGDAARTGAESWRAAGHAKVDVAGQSITANHATSQLGADIRLAPGPRLSFGELVLTQESAVRPSRIRAIAGLPTGQVYSPDEIEAAAQRLRRTGAFQSVSLSDAERIGPGDTLDIEATLVDSKPRRFGFGAELSSLEGVTLSSFWLHRNLFGGAERLRIEGEVSGIGGDSGGEDYIFSARFDRPATFTPDTSLFLGFRAQHLDEPDFREESLRVEGGLSHIFSDTLTGEAGIAYQYSETRDGLGQRTLEHLFLPVSLTYDTRDADLDAKRGLYADLDVTPFAGLDNGSAGARVYSDLRSYTSFGENDRFTFAARGQLGVVSGATALQIPSEMLFFSGGAGTVRGQSYQSLGVPVSPTQQVGGRSFAALSAELRAAVADKWQVVGFADGGFVAASDDFSGGRDHYGAGLGVRYDTGIGPIRFDVATPIGSDAGDGVEIYIGIGQAF
jgi:translocation and assembly module TamA